MKRGWTRVKFGEMAEHIAERVEPTETDGETYIGLEHLDSGSLTVLRWGTDVTLVGTKLRMRKGDILFGRRNAYLRRVAIAPHDGLFSAHGMVLRARSELVLHEFLPFFMQSDVFMERAGQISVGSVSPTINWGTLKEQEFVLPSIDEQQRIADMLHSSSVLLDRMVDVETDHDVVVRALIDAYVEQIVPDAKRLAAAGEAGPTAVLPLNDAAKVTDCKHRTPTLVDDGVPMVAPGDIRWGSLQLEGCKRIASSEYDDFMDHVTVAPGDLVLSRNQTYGVAAYVTTSDRFALGQDTVLVQGARYPTSFVYLMLRSTFVQRQIERQATGTTFKRVNLGDLRRLGIPAADQTQVETLTASCEALRDRASEIAQRRKACMRVHESLLNAALSEGRDDGRF